MARCHVIIPIAGIQGRNEAYHRGKLLLMRICAQYTIHGKVTGYIQCAPQSVGNHSGIELSNAIPKDRLLINEGKS